MYRSLQQGTRKTKMRTWWCAMFASFFRKITVNAYIIDTWWFWTNTNNHALVMNLTQHFVCDLLLLVLFLFFVPQIHETLIILWIIKSIFHLTVKIPYTYNDWYPFEDKAENFYLCLLSQLCRTIDWAIILSLLNKHKFTNKSRLKPNFIQYRHGICQHVDN